MPCYRPTGVFSCGRFQLSQGRTRLGSQHIEIVRPPLKHRCALLQVLRTVVGTPIGVLDSVRQLSFYHQRVDLQRLCQQGPGCRPEAMNRLHGRAVPQSQKGCTQGVVRDGSFMTALARENKRAVTGNGV